MWRIGHTVGESEISVFLKRSGNTVVRPSEVIQWFQILVILAKFFLGIWDIFQTI